MPIGIELKYLYRDLGEGFWPYYEILDQKFRESIGADHGNLAVGKQQLKYELRVNILALCNNEPTGFIRLDLRNQPPLIGDLYVDPVFRGKEIVLEKTPWLKKEKYLWQTLVKAAYILARRAGYKEVGSYIHTKKGKQVKVWRITQISEWELEVNEMNEPQELLDLLKKQK